MYTSELLRQAMRHPEKPAPILDSAEAEDGPALSGADDYTRADIALSVAAAIQQWVETDDLDDGEGCADRLMALLVGIADANKDGEISDEEAGVLEMALNAAWDYLERLDVPEEDIDELLNEWDSEVADRVRDLVSASLPEGEAVADAEIDQFVFGADDQDAVFDATYKLKMAVRGGKKMRIRKRISGRVRLSAKQKIAIRKARMKSHSAGAMMRRMKSMRMRRKMGL